MKLKISKRLQISKLVLYTREVECECYVSFDNVSIDVFFHEYRLELIQNHGCFFYEAELKKHNEVIATDIVDYISFNQLTDTLNIVFSGHNDDMINQLIKIAEESNNTKEKAS
ncbi:MAG: hypothetical protein ABIK73_06045 [candidate division WOR-3 bacterium]